MTRSEGLEESIADRIWTVLVQEAGASERDRAAFVYHQTHHFVTEYRFCGNLGFGGKIWRGSSYQSPVYVTCYGEDENTKRTKAIENTNRKLKELFESLVAC
jgi:hypothetical protein